MIFTLVECCGYLFIYGMNTLSVYSLKILTAFDRWKWTFMSGLIEVCMQSSGTVSYTRKASLKLYSPTQSIFQRAIFKYKPPIIITCTDSPYTSAPFPLCKFCYSKYSLINDGNRNIPWIKPFICSPLYTQTMLNHCRSSWLFINLR